MKLRDFYREAVQANEAGQKWAGNYYGVFTKVVAENQYERTAEVGAGYGTHSKYILQNNPSITHHIIIDPMRQYANDGFSDDIMNQEPESPGENFNELFQLIQEELSPWADKYTWIRKPSQEVTEAELPDGSLDCIFIDGDHSYNAVLKDLMLYWKKVRPGGQLLGDDYWMEEVRDAVNTFAEIQGLTYDILQKPGTDYKIYRFLKGGD
jgi:hypothetical protein